MQMRHALPSIRPVIDDEPKPALLQTLLFRYFLCDEKQVPQQRLILLRARGNPLNLFLRNNQNVDRCFGLNIVECETLIVFIRNPGRDFTRDDLGKYRTHSQF